MALATVADVKRVLRLADDAEPRDTQLAEALAAIEAWAEPRLQNFDSGASTESFYDIAEDATLAIPPGVTVSQVSVGMTVDEELVLDDIDWEYDSAAGRLMLRPNMHVVPFENVDATRFRRDWQHVRIDYTNSAGVPANVRDAIALLAAGYWRTGPQILADLNAEKIGDYSYSVSGGGVDDQSTPRFIRRALWLLGRHLKRHKVMAI